MNLITKLHEALVTLVSLPVLAYRKWISPMKPPCCRFTPTCSKYALDALKEWGILCGLALAAWRVLRCNPFGKGGYDPVPRCPWRSHGQ